MKKAVILLAVLALFPLSSLPAQSGNSAAKYALVIGNSKYQKIETLLNPEKDANDVAAKLQRLGYDTTIRVNMGNAEMGRVIAEYIQKLNSHSNSEGFFWYAGHGIQIKNENYLLPVDIDAKDTVDIEYGSYPLNRLIQSFEETARNRVNVVVLDACRNNPFRNLGGANRSLSRGLSVVKNLPPDLFILFSTSAGDVAADGERGRNSPFAEAFMKHMESSDDFSIVMRRVAQETLRLTDYKQRPYHEGSILKTDYYSLNPGARVTDRDQPSVTTGAAPANTNQDAVLHYEKGNASYNRGDYDMAIADYTEAIRLDPNYANAYYNRGVAYENKKDYDRAIGDYTQAIRINPNYAVAYNNRGGVYVDKKDYDRAIADYTEAIRLDPNYANAYYNRGFAYGNKKDYDRAIADYTEAIRLDPNYAFAYYNRGIAYSNKKNNDRAIADYTEAIRINPNDEDYWFNRAWDYDEIGDYDKAIADLTQVLRINPNNAKAKENLALARKKKRGR
ncbi:hypothetical protein FACS1894137_09920 [Spirochaetia bacterium]|nr:hypothetical protein FACS1894137_09920 [Spirochaetia bacterium]